MSAAALEARGLTWTPLGQDDPILDGVDLRVEPGERVLLAGASGAGKSTLLRALAGVLGEAEAGDLDGQVRVDGEPVRAGDGRVGLVLQDPAVSLVAGRVGRDVAFGPENLGVPRAEIGERVAGALAAVDFPYGPEHRSAALSGGEAQRLALAGVLAMRPDVLLLDEPTAMLDDDSAAHVRDAVAGVVADRRVSLVVVEHRLDRWLGVGDGEGGDSGESPRISSTGSWCSDARGCSPTGRPRASCASTARRCWPPGSGCPACRRPSPRAWSFRSRGMGRPPAAPPDSWSSSAPASRVRCGGVCRWRAGPPRCRHWSTWT
ncbi:ABC transporter ATP-binding protein [Mobilicoccus caccae]|uniref:ABC transporter domain-containing protein n=1 Tax=Mobilicoccus caccae TaxID=1859295 RepID=A0ABQ6IWB9_9MICO|nr:ABC transporter ATP-binding protein [Mobilicoccus caccae]GMA42222.1 hypothetical protein GCM10025883_42670 [Mobilicoccus caccae]